MGTRLGKDEKATGKSSMFQHLLVRTDLRKYVAFLSLSTIPNLVRRLMILLTICFLHAHHPVAIPVYHATGCY